MRRERRIVKWWQAHNRVGGRQSSCERLGLTNDLRELRFKVAAARLELVEGQHGHDADRAWQPCCRAWPLRSSMLAPLPRA